MTRSILRLGKPWPLLATLLTALTWGCGGSYSAGGGGGAYVPPPPPPPAPANATITIDSTKTHPISPFIYGINFYSPTTDPPLLTLDRAGGNRWTAYNWETNASNAGNDYLFQSDDYLARNLPLADRAIPGEVARTFIAADRTANMASLITVQLQGLVSADEAGPVSVTNPPDLSRFKTVIYKKSSVPSAPPFTLTPDTTAPNVYMDEFVWALDKKLPPLSGQPGIFAANAAHPTFVSLDNEPELWNTTHLEVQGPKRISSDTYIANTISLATALKAQFPEMVIFGPVHYGFQGIYSWQNELTPTPGGANWFPDKYLTALKTASGTGKPLVDVYDFHWYPEDYDASGTRILDMKGTSLSDAQVQLIVQSPRNLWDPTFTDAGNSNPWVYNELGHTPINILGRLQSKINAEFPGMKLAVTEYQSGGWNHIAGTIAQADSLGIFGSQGLFAANFWPPGGTTYSYALAGFRAFRGFDGATASFGDTSVQATSSSVQDVMVYASTDTTAPGRVVFVAINRSTSVQMTTINGLALSGTAHLYQMTAASAQSQAAAGTPVQPVSAGTLSPNGSSLTVPLPPLSVTTIDVK
ncbi:MAG: hypothetical protein NVS9B4_22870 [Candidatus Acidiferrum sp.]